MRLNTKEMIYISLFTSLTIIGAFLSIPIGNIPISMQTVFVLLSGIILGGKLAAISQIIYILIGLVGLRVFAGFKGGVQIIFSPTFGFLIGFIFASFIVGNLIKNNKKNKFVNFFIITLIGSTIVYIFGLPYMYFILNKILKTPISFIQTIKTGCFIFIPGDILKSFIAAFIGFEFQKRFNIESIY